MLLTIAFATATPFSTMTAARAAAVTNPIGQLGTRSARSSRIVRLAATAVLVGAAMVNTAVPASAQTFGAGWLINASADCRLGTHAANVFVSVKEPLAPTSGLTFWVEIWAKARYEPATQWNMINAGNTGLIKTWSRTASGALYANTPKTILTGTFTGNVRANYDIGVQYWFHAPNTSVWTGPYFFELRLDPHSSVTTYDAWGYAIRSVKDCSL